MKKLISPMTNRHLILCESILFKGGGIFKKHIRWRVIDDKDTLKRLVNTNEWKALEYYEAFYSEMLSTSQYDQQYDIYNNLHVIIDAGLKTNESIYEEFYNKKQSISRTRRQVGRKGGRPKKQKHQ